jgi:hypothetical protein
VGGSDIINIWETSALVHFEPEHKRLEKNPNAQLKSLVTWRSDAGATGPRNGEHEPERPTEPSLSWSSDGESLAFAVDRQVSFVTAAFDVRCMRVLTMWQIAVIRFQSPLKDSGKEEASEQVNGVQS